MWCRSGIGLFKNFMFGIKISYFSMKYDNEKIIYVTNAQELTIKLFLLLLLKFGSDMLRKILYYEILVRLLYGKQAETENQAILHIWHHLDTWLKCNIHTAEVTTVYFFYLIVTVITPYPYSLRVLSWPRLKQLCKFALSISVFN